MPTQDAFNLVAAVVASFGSGALIVIGLSTWLGNLWAKRILQIESAAFQREIESIRHELNIAKSSYDQRLSFILEYYAVFYRHYRLCQRTASADAHRKLPDGPVQFTKDEFLNSLDQFIADWASVEGRIRLLLPAKLLVLHEEAVDTFNSFKSTVDAFRNDDNGKSRQIKENAFAKIDDLKSRLESKLREFLRTEKLLDWKSDF